MNPICSEHSGSFRSHHVRMPTWARIDELYGQYEADLEPGASPTHENIWTVIHREIAGEGLRFQQAGGGLDLGHLASISGCSLPNLERHRELLREYQAVDPSVPPFRRVLREALEHDIALDKLVRYPSGGVNEYYYAEKTDTDPHLVLQFPQTLHEFRLRAEGIVSGTVTEERLRYLLDLDASHGCLVADRSGKISRRHYAKLMGVTNSALTRFKPVFKEYEERFVVETGPMKRFDEIREWTMDRYDRGLLELQNGKIRRVEILRHFGIAGGASLQRYPRFQAMFDALDARAQTESYQSMRTRENLAKVKAWLDRGPKINSDRLSVSRAALSQECEIGINFLWRSPLCVPLDEYDRKLFADAQASKVDPFFYGRVYAFSGLIDWWPQGFLENVGIAFKRFASSWCSPEDKEDIPRGSYIQFFDALLWIGQSLSAACRHVHDEATRFGRVRNAQDWENALYEYRAYLFGRFQTGEVAANTINNTIRGLTRVLDGLQVEKVTPSLPRRLRGVPKSSLEIVHMPTVAEAVSFDRSSRAELKAVIKSRLLNACAENQAKLTEKSAERFVENLVDQACGTGHMPEDPLKAVIELLIFRLNSIRDAALALVFDAKSKLRQGQSLIQQADVNPIEFQRKYTATKQDRVRKELVRQSFPYGSGGSEAERERSLGNMLRLIDQLTGGVPPAVNSEILDSFFAKRYSELGGIDQVEPFAIPTTETVSAVLALYLLESGANVSVGRKLLRGRIQDSHKANFKRIAGSKRRAKGKPIIVHMREDNPAVVSLKWLEDATEVLSEALEVGGNSLFLTRIGERVQLLSATSFSVWFRKLIKSVNGLGGLRITPGMLRPSILLRAALENDGRLQVGMAIGQHLASSTRSYQHRLPTELIYEHDIRRYQNSYEAIATRNFNGAAEVLGVPSGELQKRLDGLRDTGLGVFCKDRHGRPGHEGAACNEPDCAGCPQLLVVADVEKIAVLRLWREALLAVRADWLRDRPERWSRKYQPWLDLVDTVEEQMVRDYIQVWNASEMRLKEIRSLPEFSLPMPW
ncbi:hypothetical protein [Tardiphaga robiniae]|uniref:Uncharacterized protein n=1 Tax=Tardiphaga robiniae TaxID=943830 RepID=A0A7G6TTX7_9BRAD|nr:hypothetical protein [Tardiphaga robiniae]QND70209.1 hypothetical protein HB776_02365 [Tardiphaga robiniae]